MIGSTVFSRIDSWQHSMYLDVRNLALKHKNLARLSAIPVSILDVTLETVAIPLRAIQGLALTIIHLFGAAFSKEYTLGKAWLSLELLVTYVIATPVVIAFAPIRILSQLISTAYDPIEARCFHHKRNVHNGELG